MDTQLGLLKSWFCKEIDVDLEVGDEEKNWSLNCERDLVATIIKICEESNVDPGGAEGKKWSWDCKIGLATGSLKSAKRRL